MTTHVAQLYPLEVIPDALVVVEIVCLAGKLFRVHPFGRPSLEKIFDPLPAMDRQAVPDHHQFAWNLAQEDPQEPYDGCGIIGGRTHLQKQSSIEGDATDGLEMIARQRHAHDGCLASWRPDTHGHRQEIKAGLIYPDDGGFVLLGFFLTNDCLKHQTIQCSSLIVTL